MRAWEEKGEVCKSDLKIQTNQTKDVELMLVYYWPTVYDAGAALFQRLVFAGRWDMRD